MLRSRAFDLQARFAQFCLLLRMLHHFDPFSFNRDKLKSNVTFCTSSALPEKPKFSEDKKVLLPFASLLAFVIILLTNEGISISLSFRASKGRNLSPLFISNSDLNVQGPFCKKTLVRPSYFPSESKCVCSVSRYHIYTWKAVIFQLCKHYFILLGGRVQDGIISARLFIGLCYR